MILTALAIVATLYAAVGQAGGTGYIAVMGIGGFAPDVIKPTALALNILVATIGCVRFFRAGLLTWRSCYPFAVLGAPFSLIGGAIHLPVNVYQPVVGILLLIAVIRMLRSANAAAPSATKCNSEPPFLPSLLAGGAVGLVSGTTGVGGGIMLAPLVLSMGWVETRQASAVSAMFNLMNSAAALAGVWATKPALPDSLPWWLAAVGLGAALGSWLGAHYLPDRALKLILAALLLVAGLRMVVI